MALVAGTAFLRPVTAGSASGEDSLLYIFVSSWFSRGKNRENQYHKNDSGLGGSQLRKESRDLCVCLYCRLD